ncbi:MAG: GTPase ObgE, partial [Burkholderiales bacterium]
VKEAKAIINELKKYDQSLFDKPRWLVLNKVDLLDEEEADKRVKAIIKGLKWKGPHFTISAMKADGCQALTFAIMEHGEQNRQRPVDDAEATEATDTKRVRTPTAE